MISVDRITLQFTHMDVEQQDSDASSGLCSHDWVKVLQGDNPDAPIHGTYCGDTIPASITSTSYALTVMFSSDVSIQRTGFSASYSKSTSCKHAFSYSTRNITVIRVCDDTVVLAVCGGNITAQNGAISTPNYPSSYPRDAECIWYLHAGPGNRLQLSFS